MEVFELVARLREFVSGVNAVPETRKGNEKKAGKLDVPRFLLIET